VVVTGQQQSNAGKRRPFLGPGAKIDKGPQAPQTPQTKGCPAPRTSLWCRGVFIVCFFNVRYLCVWLFCLYCNSSRQIILLIQIVYTLHRLLRPYQLQSLVPVFGSPQHVPSIYIHDWRPEINLIIQLLHLYDLSHDHGRKDPREDGREEDVGLVIRGKIVLKIWTTRTCLIHSTSSR